MKQQGKRKYVYMTVAALLLSTECWAADTASSPENTPIDKSLLRLTGENGNREVHIPMAALQGKALPAITATIRQAYQLLTQDKEGSLAAPTAITGAGNSAGRKEPVWAREDAIAQLSQNTLSVLMATTQNATSGNPLSATCPFLTLGTIPSATLAKEYRWLPMNAGSGFIAFWPTFLPPEQTPTYGTYTGNWSGATGAHFIGKARIPGNWWGNDPVGVVASAEVFQYTLPSLTCDSVVLWQAEGVVDSNARWEINADWGHIDTDWVTYVSPSGGGFPSSIYSYQFFTPGAMLAINGARYRDNQQHFEGNFTVGAGIQPRIYLGLSLMLWVQDGVASTMLYGILGDTYKFPGGIVYLRAPQS